MSRQLLHELTRILNMHGMESLEGTQLRLVLEGGGESYVLDAEENEAGLLLGLGAALQPHEQEDTALLARAALTAQQAGLRALRREGLLYFAATVPAAMFAKEGAGVLHRALEHCLHCQHSWRESA